MKIRALLWDRVPSQGEQSRRGPVRENGENYQAARDLAFLKQNAYEEIHGTVIDDRDKNWNGPTDTIFNANPNP